MRCTRDLKKDYTNLRPGHRESKESELARVACAYTSARLVKKAAVSVFCQLLATIGENRPFPLHTTKIIHVPSETSETAKNGPKQLKIIQTGVFAKASHAWRVLPRVHQSARRSSRVPLACVRERVSFFCLFSLLSCTQSPPSMLFFRTLPSIAKPKTNSENSPGNVLHLLGFLD